MSQLEKWYTKDGQIIDESNGKTIATLPYFDESDDVAARRARLIAAAPEMYELLKKAGHLIAETIDN